MPRKRKYKAEDAAEDLVADMLKGTIQPDPINIAEEVDGMIAMWGFDKGAEDAAIMADYYRSAENVEMANDWAEVHRLILQRKSEQGPS